MVAGGLFATLQSAAAGGYGVAAVAGSAQGLAGAAAAAVGYSTIRGNSTEEEGANAEGAEEEDKDKDKELYDKEGRHDGEEDSPPVGAKL